MFIMTTDSQEWHRVRHDKKHYRLVETERKSIKQKKTKGNKWEEEKDGESK